MRSLQNAADDISPIIGRNEDGSSLIGRGPEGQEKDRATIPDQFVWPFC